jgi:hypothetical protein
VVHEGVARSLVEGELETPEFTVQEGDLEKWRAYSPLEFGPARIQSKKGNGKMSISSHTRIKARFGIKRGRKGEVK